MKRFLFIISVFAVYIAALHTIFPVLVDPFNIFHADSIRDNGIQPNQNYIRTKYILGNKDTYNGFMFGSSRVGAIHTDKIPGAKVYNMAYPNGLPSEHLANIMTFLENGIKAGVVRIRYMRPFPNEEIAEVLKNAKAYGVLEKDISFGNEGTVYTNVNSALKKAGVNAPGYDFVGGLGGRNISHGDIEKIFSDIAAGTDSVTFIGIGGGNNG